MKRTHPHLASDNPPSPLVGGAIGDAAGAPYEQIASGPPVPRSWDGQYHATRHFGLQAGEYTDDTLLARALAAAIVSHGGYDARTAAAHYLETFKRDLDGTALGCGGTLRKAFEAMRAGTPWYEAGVKHTSWSPGPWTGNGAAMRSAPLGLWYAESPALPAAMARIDGRITHATEDGETGAALVAAGVASLIKHGDKTEFLEVLLQEAPPDSEFRTAVGDLGAFWTGANTAGVKAARALFHEARGVIDTVCWAAACFLWSNTFEEAIRPAIEAGGDTDTNASIAGAFAGAFYGQKAFRASHLFLELRGAGSVVGLEYAMLRRSPYLHAVWAATWPWPVPVAGAAARKDCTCLGGCRKKEGAVLGDGWRCVLEEPGEA